MKNNSVRNRILSRLRKEEQIQLPEKYTKAGTRDWPTWEPEERVQYFRAQMESVRTEIHECTKENWSNCLAQIIKEKEIQTLVCDAKKSVGNDLEALKNGLPQLNLVQPDVIENGFKEVLFNADAALTEAKAGIAETGTLVLWPDQDEPRLISLIPPIHIVILNKNKIYNSFKEIAHEENWKDSLPTNALLISGPSKTADIEFNLAYGIHGPCELIVLLL